MEESMKNVAIEEAAKKDLIDDASAIFKMIKDLCLYCEIREVGVDMLQKRVLAKGFTLDALQNTIVHYEMMDVLLWDKVKNTVQLVGQD
jgi:ribosomal protein L25 (general stress protein Ctc)